MLGSVCLGAGSNCKLKIKRLEILWLESKFKWLDWTRGLRFYLQSILHELINFHDSGFVSASVAIVGSGEHCNYISFVRPVVAVHDQLMGT